MFFNLNTSKSIHTAKSEVAEVVHTLGGIVDAAIHTVEGEVETVEKDSSAIIHSITATPLAVGTDISIRLHHAAGEVKRIVIQGGMTVESFIAQLRNLTK